MKYVPSLLLTWEAHGSSQEWRAHPNITVIFGNRREESVPSNVFPNNRVVQALQAYLILTCGFLCQGQRW